MKQKFEVEKDPSPMHTSRPWRVRCTGDEGPYKPHITAGFSTKKRAQWYANELAIIVDSYLKYAGKS